MTLGLHSKDIMVEKHKKELETYETHKKELIARHKGKFVLIKGGEVIGIFNTKTDAVFQGKKSFEKEYFLVKQILDTNTSEGLGSNVFKIIYAINNYTSTKKT